MVKETITLFPIPESTCTRRVVQVNDFKIVCIAAKKKIYAKSVKDKVFTLVVDKLGVKSI